MMAIGEVSFVCLFCVLPVVFDDMSKYRRYPHRRSLLHSLDHRCWLSSFMGLNQLGLLFVFGR